ncbi:MAG: hypothetical protein H6658_06520 [Ardenticatenaceae bacterium]|nr:hypothetical protein [Ardenticatenaceae bacterium]
MFKQLKRRWVLLLATTAVCLTFSLVMAGGTLLPRTLLSSGGSIVSQNNISLHSAIGQPAIGTVANGDILCSGYLCDASAPPVSGGTHHIYLPFIHR